MSARPAEVTRLHTRLMKCALEVEDARAYWRRAGGARADHGSASPRCAFEEYWFGARSLARVEVLVANREDDAIANAVANLFPAQAQKLRDVWTRLDRIPGPTRPPQELARLQDVIEQCVRGCRQTLPTVKLVKKHLEALQDGIQQLSLYDAELQPDAIAAVRAAADVRDYQVSQLRGAMALTAEVEAAAQRLETHLDGPRPWREVGALGLDLAAIRLAYAAERRRLLAWQEEQVEQARARVTGRDGFATLTADQAHQVLRPLNGARTDTTAEAIAPALDALKDPFSLALNRAEEEANSILDGILSEGKRPLVVKVDLKLRNRDVATVAQVEALVEEIRKRLLEHVPGSRVRLV